VIPSSSNIFTLEARPFMLADFKAVDRVIVRAIFLTLNS
jgi:hypothetical protein